MKLCRGFIFSLSLMFLFVIQGVYGYEVPDNVDLYIPSSETPTIIGEVVGDGYARGGSAIRVTSLNQQGGTLQFGPYEDSLETGKDYIARFRLKISNNSSIDKKILIDVFNWSSGHREYIEVRPAEFTAVDEYQEFEIPFTRGDSGYEFRVFYYALSDFDLYSDGVEIVDPTSNVIFKSVPASQYTGIGELTPDLDANNAQALLATPTNQQGGTLLFGPYETVLENGENYIARFRLKVSDNSETQNKILIDAFNWYSGHREYLEISPSNFNTSGEYQEFEVPFTRGFDGYEFRVFYYGASNFDLYSDGVEIIDPDMVVVVDNSGSGSTSTPGPYANTQNFFVTSVFLDGKGVNATTIAEMDDIRADLVSIDSDLTVTWAMSLDFVFDEANRPQLAHVLSMVDTYGDEISIGDGFPNNNSTLASFQTKMDEWAYMYRYNALNDLHVFGTFGDSSVWDSIPEAYRPTSLTAYAVNHEQAQHLKDTWGIDAMMGWTATQYNVDQLSAVGSPLMPYYSHINSPMVPAQTQLDSSDIVFMNTLTVDPIGSRYTSGESRWTIHPADPNIGGTSQIHTINQYLTNPYSSDNTVNYISLLFDINWISGDTNLSNNWDYIVNNFPTGSDIQVVGINEFADVWKQRSGNYNSGADFTLQFRGSGDSITLTEPLDIAGTYISESDLQYLWTETKTERIILSKNDLDTSWQVIDFTDYSAEITPLAYTTLGAGDDVSYVTGRNYKLSPSYPLSETEQTRIASRLNAIGFSDSYSF